VGWDKAICDALDEMRTGFCYPDDGYEHEALPTCIAMTSDIVRALGWMCLPTSQHLYIDHVWRDLAKAIGRFRYLLDVLIEHLSTYNDKADEDDTSRDHWNSDAHNADRLAYQAWLWHDKTDDVAKLKALLTWDGEP
jgi:hypothetical protein